MAEEAGDTYAKGILQIDLESGASEKIEGFSLHPPPEPETHQITERPARLGWSELHNAPAEYRPGKGIRPLLEPGVIRDIVRQFWAGHQDRVYLLLGDFRVVCIDRQQRKVLWSTSELTPIPRSGYWLVDSGDHGAVVREDGEILVFDPRTGVIQHKVSARKPQS